MHVCVCLSLLGASAVQLEIQHATLIHNYIAHPCALHVSAEALLACCYALAAISDPLDLWDILWAICLGFTGECSDMCVHLFCQQLTLYSRDVVPYTNHHPCSGGALQVSVLAQCMLGWC